MTEQLKQDIQAIQAEDQAARPAPLVIPGNDWVERTQHLSKLVLGVYVSIDPYLKAIEEVLSRFVVDPHGNLENEAVDILYNTTAYLQALEISTHLDFETALGSVWDLLSSEIYEYVAELANIEQIYEGEPNPDEIELQESADSLAHTLTFYYYQDALRIGLVEIKTELPLYAFVEYLFLKDRVMLIAIRKPLPEYLQDTPWDYEHALTEYRKKE